MNLDDFPFDGIVDYDLPLFCDNVCMIIFSMSKIGFIKISDSISMTYDDDITIYDVHYEIDDKFSAVTDSMHGVLCMYERLGLISGYAHYFSSDNVTIKLKIGMMKNGGKATIEIEHKFIGPSLAVTN